MKGNGELCGDTKVSAYGVNPVPAGSATEKVFATTITTSGTSDGSVHPGAMTWFYDLVQQPDGSWRLAGGGSGPQSNQRMPSWVGAPQMPTLSIQ